MAHKVNTRVAQLTDRLEPSMRQYPEYNSKLYGDFSFVKTDAPKPSNNTSTSPFEGDSSMPMLGWPASGQVVNEFDEVRNKGVDIAGKMGDPILAAANGRVVYAGSGLRGYGHLIILRHTNNMLTTYAHNNKLVVKEDQEVLKGQKIAEMGHSDSDRVKLSFEIRHQGEPVDPRKYLSPQ